MRPRALLGLSLLVAPLILGCASTASSTTAELEAVEERWVAALRDHDTAALDRLLDDRFVDSTFRGALRSKRDVLTGPPAGGPYRSIRLEDLAVRADGGATAIVTGVNVLRGASDDDDVRVRFTDVFVREKGGWRAVAAQETLQTAR